MREKEERESVCMCGKWVAFNMSIFLTVRESKRERKSKIAIAGCNERTKERRKRRNLVETEDFRFWFASFSLSLKNFLKTFIFARKLRLRRLSAQTCKSVIVIKRPICRRR